MALTRFYMYTALYLLCCEPVRELENHGRLSRLGAPIASSYAMSARKSLLCSVTKLMFPVSSSTPVTVAAMQTHTSWVVVMSWAKARMPLSHRVLDAAAVR